MKTFFEWVVDFMFPKYKVEEYNETADFGIYYATFRGDRVCEFETLNEAKEYADMMNGLYFGAGP